MYSCSGYRVVSGEFQMNSDEWFHEHNLTKNNDHCGTMIRVRHCIWIMIYIQRFPYTTVGIIYIYIFVYIRVVHNS